MSDSTVRRALAVTAALAAVPLLAVVLWTLHEPVPPPPRSAPTPEPETHVAAPSTAPVAAPPLSASRAPTRAAEEDLDPIGLAARIARSDPAGSRAVLRRVLAKQPDHEGALAALSMKLLHDERHDDARELSARCAAAHPDDETCAHVLSYALGRGEKIDSMERETRACLAATPYDARCLSVAIGFAVRDGHLDEARGLVQSLERADPSGKPTLLARARVAGSEGRYADALADLSEACRRGMEQACVRAEALRAEGW